MNNESDGMNTRDMLQFLDKFVLFHLGRDAGVKTEILGDGAMTCHLSHSRIRDIHFKLDPAQVRVFCEEIPAFEDYLLLLLTQNRRGGESDD